MKTNPNLIIILPFSSGFLPLPITLRIAISLQQRHRLLDDSPEEILFRTHDPLWYIIPSILLVFREREIDFVVGVPGFVASLSCGILANDNVLLVFLVQDLAYRIADWCMGSARG